MLILAKAVLAFMIGFILSIIFGVVLIPLLKKMNIKQTVSVFLSKHKDVAFATVEQINLKFGCFKS